MDNSVSPSPSIVTSPKRVSIKLLLSIFTVIVIVFLILFFSLNFFARQRYGILLRLNLIPSPININNPSVSQIGVAYLFQGRITEVSTIASGKEIKIDAPQISAIQVNDKVQIYRGPNINSTPGTYEDLAVGQEVRVSLIYDLTNGEYYPMRVFIR